MNIAHKPGPIYSYKEGSYLSRLGWIVLIFAAFLILGGILFSCSRKDYAWADQEYTNEQIADAIYLAEGGAKTRHPYGILAKYKHTTPRQACINTIKHARKDWQDAPKGDFLTFLAKRYAPLGVANDPQGLNKNWLKNVRYFLEKNNDQ